MVNQFCLYNFIVQQQPEALLIRTRRTAGYQQVIVDDTETVAFKETDVMVREGILPMAIA